MVEMRSTSSPRRPGSSSVAEALVENILQARVVGLDGLQSGVDAHTDVGLLRLSADGLRARLRRRGQPIESSTSNNARRPRLAAR